MVTCTRWSQQDKLTFQLATLIGWNVFKKLKYEGDKMRVAGEYIRAIWGRVTVGAEGRFDQNTGQNFQRINKQKLFLKHEQRAYIYVQTY